MRRTKCHPLKDHLPQVLKSSCLKATSLQMLRMKIFRGEFKNQCVYQGICNFI